MTSTDTGITISINSASPNTSSAICNDCESDSNLGEGSDPHPPKRGEPSDFDPGVPTIGSEIASLISEKVKRVQRRAKPETAISRSADYLTESR
jgi:hypothetical protein